MCGIIACLSLRKDIKQYLIDGLFQLRNRGFDSAGISMFGRNCLFYEKFASFNKTFDSIDLLEDKVNKSANVFTCGIGHTRWATTGEVSNVNAHPHVSKNISVVHNGIIENYAILKHELQSQGFIFKSETDTEVIAVIIDREMSNFPERSTLLNFQNALKHIEGTWAIVMINSEEPDKLFVSRFGSPLILGYNTETVWIVSEQSALCGQVSKYISIPKNSTFVISNADNRNDFSIYSTDMKSPCQLLSQIFKISSLLKQDFKNVESDVLKDVKHPPLPYKYWTEKEIYEQSEAISRAMNNGGRLSEKHGVSLGGLNINKEKLLNIRHLILIGCGTSENAARYVAPYFKELTTFTTVQVFDASEFVFADLPQCDKEHIGVLIVSQSGETKDCQTCLTWLPDNIVTIGVINVVGSWLAESCDCGVYVNAGRELGVASTKSFTCQIVVLAQICLWFANYHDQIIYNNINELIELPSLVASVLKFDNSFAVANVAKSVLEAKGTRFILGRGYGFTIAKEAALKLKELTYLSFEGYSGGSLKHGPLSLLSTESVCLVIILKGDNCKKMISCLREIIARKSKVVVISNACDQFTSDYKNIETIIDISQYTNDEFNAGILSILFFQLLSVETSVLLGNHPDFPRSLAKSVTVG
jgi:glucosamine--fructose-6-phosphate aminotransferase (isomerizing)